MPTFADNFRFRLSFFFGSFLCGRIFFFFFFFQFYAPKQWNSFLITSTWWNYRRIEKNWAKRRRWRQRYRIEMICGGSGGNAGSNPKAKKKKKRKKKWYSVTNDLFNGVATQRLCLVHIADAKMATYRSDQMHMQMVQHRNVYAGTFIIFFLLFDLMVLYLLIYAHFMQMIDVGYVATYQIWCLQFDSTLMGLIDQLIDTFLFYFEKWHDFCYWFVGEDNLIIGFN